MNLDFFERLYADPEFCGQLGRTTMASGRFESNLRAYLALRGVTVQEKRATLGTLSRTLAQHDFISENGAQALDDLKDQRNYLSHSIFDLFAARASKEPLPSADLLPSDTSMFVDVAWQLEQNLAGLNELVESAIERLLSLSKEERSGCGRLFSP